MMANPSRLFITRPIATSLLMLAIVITGLIAYRLLPISSLPEVEYPTIQITTFYPGASPHVMATTVTAPLEKQLGQIAGLDQMFSSSSNSASIITLQFSLDVKLDVVEQEVQAAINAASAFLPADLPSPPIYNKVNPADTPIITLALTSSVLPLPQIEDYADTRFAPQLSQLAGVGLVSLSGGQRPAIRIQANTNILASYGLSLENLRLAIQSANVNLAKGSINGPRLGYTINSNDQLLSKEDYRALIIAYKNNAPIRLSDVAQISDGAENNYQAAWSNSTPAIIINVQRQPGANVIAVADRIKKLLPTLSTVLPKTVNVALLNDRTETIRTSIAHVQFELMLAIALVVMVIFIFLRNLSATVIPTFSVPISLIGTFGVMYLAGFTLNNLTLMALTIATGFVVDDAIVMIENITRYLEQGEQPLTAALKGSKQIAFTIISLTISLIAVLIPLLFMQDVIGRLFREFALTLSVAIVISAVVSLTLTPMLCAYLLNEQKVKATGKLTKKIEEILEHIISFYKTSLHYVLNQQVVVLKIFGLTLIITAILFYTITKELFPVQDTGLIQGVAEADPSVSFAAMSEHQQKLIRHLLLDPAIENISSFIGIDNSNNTLNKGRFLITLKPSAQRDLNANEVIEQLREKFTAIPGVKLYLQPIQDMTLETRVTPAQYQLSIFGSEQTTVDEWSQFIVQKLQHLPELIDVAENVNNAGLETYIEINRETAARLGITTKMIDDALYDAFGQRQISTLFTQRNQYHVILEALSSTGQTLDRLDSIYLNSNTGKPIPLSVLAQIRQGKKPLSINHQEQFPVTTVSFNLARGYSLGDAINSIDRLQHELQLPDTIKMQFEGTANVFAHSLSNQFWLVLAAVIVVYIILGVLYESYIHPLTILSTLPSACMGALLALFITNHALSVIALIGIILLIGIVMKNAIMMVDFALEQERNDKKLPQDAIYAAAILRFRPILMTTLAALFGAIPLALSHGMGAELRQPLGIAIIGGLIVSQLLTLYTTPVIYLAFSRLVNWLQKEFRSNQ